MEDILAELNQKFAGQATARLDTYAGKMDLLRVAAADASETIGKSLVDAISKLGKDTSIENLTKDIDALATSIASVVTGVGALIGVLSDLRNAPGIKQIIDVLRFGNLFDMLKKLGELSQPAPTSNFTYSLGASATKDVERAKEILRLRTSNKLRQDEINKMKAKTEVDKLEEKFNVERIALMKALGEATDAETKLRIQAKLAILDNNEALAKKYNAELAASAAAKALADSATNAANALNTLPNKYDQIFTSLVGQLKSMGIEAGAAAGLAASSARLQAQYDAFLAQTGQYAVPGGMPSSASTAAAAAAPTVVPQVTVNTGAVLTSEQDLSIYIQNALGQITKLGNGALIPAGSIAFQ